MSLSKVIFISFYSFYPSANSGISLTRIVAHKMYFCHSNHISFIWFMLFWFCLWAPDENHACGFTAYLLAFSKQMSQNDLGLFTKAGLSLLAVHHGMRPGSFCSEISRMRRFLWTGGQIKALTSFFVHCFMYLFITNDVVCLLHVWGEQGSSVQT